jgi:copper(I)-binding protein
MRRLVLATLAALAVGLPAFADDVRVDGVEIRHPWTRPAAVGFNGVGYLSLANVGTKPIKLIAAESPAAKSVTLHQTRMMGTMMMMDPVKGGLTVAPGASVAFSPGGYHLMLIGLKTSSAVGGKIPLTLVFEGGRRVAVELAVETGTGAPASMPMGSMSGMDHGKP